MGGQFGPHVHIRSGASLLYNTFSDGGAEICPSDWNGVNLAAKNGEGGQFGPISLYVPAPLLSNPFS